MSIIKIILILALICAYVIFQRYLSGKRLLARSLGVMMLVFAIIAVAFPNETTIIANFFGIGRGVDFIIYLMIVFLMYTMIIMHGNQNQIRNQVTQLAREIAFYQARPASQINQGIGASPEPGSPQSPEGQRPQSHS